MNEQSNIVTQASDWLSDTVRRKPEALLLMAAGCALLLHSGRRSVRSSRVARWDMGEDTRWDPHGPPIRSASSGSKGAPGMLGDAADRMTEYAGDIAGQVKDAAAKTGETAKAFSSNVADTVTDYADAARRNVSEYAEGARRGLSEASDRVRSQAETTYQSVAETIREQPILVGALGLAAGAVVATLFPATRMEKRTLGIASAAIAEKASEVGENLAEAANRAGERLEKAAGERGLTSDGLKEMARDVVGTFVGAASGKEQESASKVPSAPTGGQPQVSLSDSTGTPPSSTTSKDRMARRP